MTLVFFSWVTDSGYCLGPGFVPPHYTSHIHAPHLLRPHFSHALLIFSDPHRHMSFHFYYGTPAFPLLCVGIYVRAR